MKFKNFFYGLYEANLNDQRNSHLNTALKTHRKGH